MSTSLSTRLMLGYALLALTLAVAAGTSFWQMRTAERGLTRLYEDGLLMQREAERLKAMTASIDKDLLHAALAGDRDEFRRLENRLQLFFALTGRMREQVRTLNHGATREHEEMEKIAAIEDAFRNSMTAALSTLGEYLETRSSAPRLPARIRLAAGIFDHQIDDFVSVREERVDQEVDQLRTEIHVAKTRLWILLAISGILVIAGYFLLQRRLVRPLARLHGFIEHASHDPVGTSERPTFLVKDEIQRVGTAVGQLLDRLQATTVSRDLLIEKEKLEHSLLEGIEVKTAAADALHDLQTPFRTRAGRALAALSGLPGLHPRGGRWFQSEVLRELGEDSGWIGHGERIWARPTPHVDVGTVTIVSRCPHALPEHGHYFISMAHAGEEIGLLVLDCEPDLNTDEIHRELLREIGAVFALAILNEKTRQAQLKAQRRAEDASRAKSEFLANMSHELRTPLHGVIGMAQLLRNTGLSTEQKGYAEAVEDNAAALLTLVNGILDFSKMDSGELRIEHAAFDLDTTVAQALDPISIRAREKGLEFTCNIAPPLAGQYLIGDPARLGQILSILAGNAVKFTPTGHVAIEITAIEGTEGTTRIGFAIRDTGIGIPTDKLDGLFCPFTQIDASITRQHGGLGLGLSMARQIVERMGGRIGASSIIGQGSTFRFELAFALAPSSDNASQNTNTAIPLFVQDDMLRNLGGDLEIATLLLRDLLTDIPAHIDLLAAALAAHDNPVATREAHTIKGLAASGGARRLRTIALEVEHICQTDGPQPALSHLAELKICCHHTLPLWQDFLDTLPEKAERT